MNDKQLEAITKILVLLAGTHESECPCHTREEEIQRCVRDFAIMRDALHNKFDVERKARLDHGNDLAHAIEELQARVHDVEDKLSLWKKHKDK
jgi:hypothetical protein